MPIYEYKCEHCGERFEVLQKLRDDPLAQCILCAEGPVKKLISTAAFILKGAGFYVNDYPSKSRQSGTKGDKDGAEKSSTEKSEKKITEKKSD